MIYMTNMFNDLFYMIVRYWHCIPPFSLSKNCHIIQQGSLASQTAFETPHCHAPPLLPHVHAKASLAIPSAFLGQKKALVRLSNQGHDYCSIPNELHKSFRPRSLMQYAKDKVWFQSPTGSTSHLDAKTTGNQTFQRSSPLCWRRRSITQSTL